LDISEKSKEIWYTDFVIREQSNESVDWLKLKNPRDYPNLNPKVMLAEYYLGWSRPKDLHVLISPWSWVQIPPSALIVL
jgi:hypothetical protein